MWEYIEYKYPVSYSFDKQILWVSANCDIYFAMKQNDTDDWTYFSGNAAHGLNSGSVLVNYGSNETSAQTNYLTASRDKNGKVLAVLPAAFQAKYIRLYIDVGEYWSTTIYEWKPSTYLLADEIVTGELTITDELSDAPLIRVVASDTDRLKLGKIGTSTYGLSGYDDAGATIFELTADGKYMAGWNFTASQLSRNDIIISSSGKIKAGSGNDVVEIDSQDSTYRLWIGNDSPASAPFRVTKEGHLTADSGTFNGTLAASSITTKELSSDAVRAYNISADAVVATSIKAHAITTDKLDANSIVADKISANTINATHIDSLSIFGKELEADTGEIGGWILSATALKSADSGARMELRKDKNRISIFDAVNEKVAMGYLEGLTKNASPSETWGSNDYGFWAKEGDHLKIDGNATYFSGDWMIKNDGSYKILDSLDNEIIRMGTDTGKKGLFLYNTSGVTLAEYHSNGVLVGNKSASQYFEYTIADGAVFRGGLNADDITTGSLTAGQISADAITAEKIAANAVVATSIKSNAVTADKINAGAVTANKIDSNAVTAVKINAGAVTTVKLDADAVTAEKIAANAVVATSIKSSAITADKINANAVTAVKINTNAVTAIKIDSSAVTADKIAANAVTTNKINADTVNATHIKSLAVTTSKIDSYAITAAKIAANAIETTKIAANAVVATHIKSNAITTDKISANAVTATEIDVTQLSAISADIGNITAGKASNSGGTNYVDFDASGTQYFIKVGNEVEITADGEGYFARGIVSPPDVAQYGTVSITEKRANDTSESVYYVNTGETVDSSWNTTAQISYSANVTIGNGYYESSPYDPKWRLAVEMFEIRGITGGMTGTTTAWQGEDWDGRDIGLKITIAGIGGTAAADCYTTQIKWTLLKI